MPLAIGLSLATPFLSSGMGGGGFDPLVIASLSEWFDFRTLSAVGDGNPVSDWAGRKGLYTLTASGTARPTWAVDDGDGRAAVQFDGVNDKLQAACGSYSLFGTTGDFEVWSMVKFSSSQIDAGAELFVFTGSMLGISMFTNAAFFQVSAPSYAEVVYFPHTFWDDSWHLCRLSKIGARRILQIDGITLYDASTTAGSYFDNVETLSLASWNYHAVCSQRHWLSFKEPLDDTTAAALTTYLLAA